SSTRRMSAPTRVPPGSRVATTSRPVDRSRRTRRSTWVDLPAPSPPSRTTKNPDGEGRAAGRERGTAPSLGDAADVAYTVHTAAPAPGPATCTYDGGLSPGAGPGGAAGPRRPPGPSPPPARRRSPGSRRAGRAGRTW